MINLKYSFSDLSELMDFLLNTPDFDNWETIIFRVSTASGVELNIGTKIMDATGLRQFIQFKKLKAQLKLFYDSHTSFNPTSLQLNQNNSDSSLNLEIKLKLSEDLKASIDPQKMFDSFNFNFYFDGTFAFVISSAVESSKIVDITVLENWSIYSKNLYNQWLNKK